MAKHNDIDDDHYDHVEHPSAVKKLGKLLLKLSIGVLILFVALVIGTTIMKSTSLNQLQSASESLDNANHWFQYIRWIFIASLIYWWVPFNTWLADRKGWNNNQLKLVLGMRWVTLSVSMFVELIFIQRIYEWFIW